VPFEDSFVMSVSQVGAEIIHWLTTVSDFEVKQEGRSIEARAVLCAVILLYFMVVAISVIKGVARPAFILTKWDGTQIRAGSLQLVKLKGPDVDRGFDIQVPPDVIRIRSDFRGVRKLAIMSQEQTNQPHVRIRIESYFGEVIEGVCDLKSWYEQTQESLADSVTAETKTGTLTVDTRDIKSIERESSRLYEWSTRLFRQRD
jgi:hypothetical protein